MAVSAVRHRRFQIDLDHADGVLSALSTLTLDPYKNILFYFFPLLRAWSSSYVQMRENDPTQEAMMPTEEKEKILTELTLLKGSSGIKRDIDYYSALHYRFGSCGGALSATHPLVVIPHQHLFRVGKSAFTKERPEEALETDPVHFSDDQTRFLICRELAAVKKNDSLLKTIVKISLLAAIFVFYTMPFGFLGAAVIAAAAIGLYILSERLFAAKMDQVAIDILVKRLDNDRPRAIRAAIQALEKIRSENLGKRRENWLCRLYITKRGNNLLDLTHRSLTNRIARLRAM